MKRSIHRLLTLGALFACSEQVARPDTAGKHRDEGYPNVGAFLIWVDPNPIGLPEGLLSMCSGALIHPRVFLTAGHCVAPNKFELPAFIRFFVTFNADALDRSSWIPRAGDATHPSLPPCPPPQGCNGVYDGLAPGILDIGLVFLRRAVRDIEPAKLASPGTLERARAERSLMTHVGYGFGASLPGGGAPPISEWEGRRTFGRSFLDRVFDDEWAIWTVPGQVCYGDSGGPTFVNTNPNQRIKQDRLVAVAIDGGDPCFTRDYRARLDTQAAQQWIRHTIKERLGEDVQR